MTISAARQRTVTPSRRPNITKVKSHAQPLLVGHSRLSPHMPDRPPRPLLLAAPMHLLLVRNRT